MSVAGVSGLPQVAESALPAAVRNGSAKDRDAYKAALGFEQVLLSQLVEEMVPEGTLTDGVYAAPVQEALTGGLVAAGGIGLGAHLYPMLRREGS
jgi:hypothetical protein